MKKRTAAALLCMMLALSGCTSSLTIRKNESDTTLPPAETEYNAPVGDAEQDAVQTVLLYLPDVSGARLAAYTEKMLLPASRHPAETVLRKLLSYSGGEEALPLSTSVALSLASGNPVEISGNTATVNLAASALELDHGTLNVVCQAIANTVAQWNDILYINVLISGVSPGLDVASTLPVGVFMLNLTDDINTIKNKTGGQTVSASRRFTMNATLYFPVHSGKGVLSETQAVSFEGQTQRQMIEGLLGALTGGAKSFYNVPSLPDLSGLLLESPGVQEIAVGGGRKAVLRFDAKLNELLINAGVPRSVMMAALTYTLTTFLPGVNALEVSIGNEQVNVLVPSGIYSGAGVTLSFPDGLMRRSDFSAFLLNNVTLYFTNENGTLSVLQRPIPYYLARNARSLLLELMIGPQPYDSVGGLRTVFPDVSGDADVLGIALNGNTMLVNLSAHLFSQCETLNASQEALLIYAVVNTVTELPAVSRVRLFFAGAQPETLSGSVYLPGEFFRNPGIVR